MTTVKQAADAIADALAQVEGLRPYTEVDGNVQPPAAVLGPPVMTWRGYCPAGQPSTAQFPVYVIVDMNERALEGLWDAVPVVAEALSSVDNATFSQASPAVWSAGNTDLPAYLILVDIDL